VADPFLLLMRLSFYCSNYSGSNAGGLPFTSVTLGEPWKVKL